MGKCFSTGKRRGSAEPQPVEAHHASVDTSSRATMPPNPRVQDLQQTSFKDVENFTYNEMKLASRDFREMLGEGGFGIVYKGVIDGIRPGYRSTEVAIKELGRNKLQGEREWLTEVSYLGKHRHPNIVKLIGYCCESGHRLVVYEYMAFGSLDKHLFDAPRSMPLPIRMKIALGAAKALAFLHGKEPPIIYRDFKTSNVLLDSNYNPKLSDFGLARDGPTGNQSHVSTRVMGTEGYAAPEYLQTGKLTVRCDVYGFGVVLLEMLTGRRALDPNRRREERSLVVWARPRLKDTNLLVGILDPRMDGRPNLDAVSKLAMTAYCCVRELPTYRPTMNEVVQVLEELQAEAQDDSKKPPRPLSRGIIISEVPKSPANKLGDGADRQPKPRKEEGKRGSENVPRSRRTKPASEMAGSVGNPPLTDLIREDYFG